MKMMIVIFLLFSTFSIQASSNQIFSEKSLQKMERRLIDLINQERTKLGLKALKEWGVLSELAKEHSYNMAFDLVKFGHKGFENRAEVMKQHARYYSFGENVAYNFLVEDPLLTAVDGWMKSPGHRENILGDYTDTGIGIVFSKKGYCYLTQLFVKRD
jgi:uncharacterized protein YkwD